jgi:glycosyltransferase involved in cell wall biosynthesis
LATHQPDLHREICLDAGVYFSRFSAEEMADRVMAVVVDPSVVSRLRAQGLERSQDFSWGGHTDELVNLATQLGKDRTIAVGKDKKSQ